jgi:hypothetical protein
MGVASLSEGMLGGRGVADIALQAEAAETSTPTGSRS